MPLNQEGSQWEVAGVLESTIVEGLHSRNKPGSNRIVIKRNKLSYLTDETKQLVVS